MKNSPIAQFLGRHERILKIAMKVLVVLGVIYGAMACFGPGSQVQAADGPRVSKYTIQYSAFRQDEHRKWNDRLNGPHWSIQPIFPFPVPILSERTVVHIPTLH